MTRHSSKPNKLRNINPVRGRTGNCRRKLLSIYVFSYFPFGFEGRIWDLIVSVPDHCLSFYLEWSVVYTTGGGGVKGFLLYKLHPGSRYNSLGKSTKLSYLKG